LLEQNEIQVLADVRNFPGSRKYPHFNTDHLAKACKQKKIEYIHIKTLGGRRKPAPDSENTGWRSKAFQAYADYMNEDDFKEGLQELEELAAENKVAYMCSEAVWWRCHRSLISDLLKFKGWEVLHIMQPNKVQEHPYTGPARKHRGKLAYGEKGKLLRE